MSGYQTRQIVELSRQVAALTEQRDALKRAMVSASSYFALGLPDVARHCIDEALRNDQPL